MKLAIILVHNKGNQGNIDQIEALKQYVESYQESVTTDDGPAFIQKCRFKDTQEEVDIIHVVPFQPENLKLNFTNPEDGLSHAVYYEAKTPANFHDLYSYCVKYGIGDEDKVGTHPRFFNWGLKRGTDRGADTVLYLADSTKFTPQKLAKKLAKLSDFDEDDYGTFGTLKLQRDNIGKEVLKESKPFPEAVAELKQKVARGGKNG